MGFYLVVPPILNYAIIQGDDPIVNGKIPEKTFFESHIDVRDDLSLNLLVNESNALKSGKIPTQYTILFYSKMYEDISFNYSLYGLVTNLSIISGNELDIYDVSINNTTTSIERSTSLNVYSVFNLFVERELQFNSILLTNKGDERVIYYIIKKDRVFNTDDDIVMDNTVNFFDSSIDISVNDTIELLKDGLILDSDNSNGNDYSLILYSEQDGSII